MTAVSLTASGPPCPSNLSYSPTLSMLQVAARVINTAVNHHDVGARIIGIGLALDYVLLCSVYYIYIYIYVCMYISER